VPLRRCAAAPLRRCAAAPLCRCAAVPLCLCAALSVVDQMVAHNRLVEDVQRRRRRDMVRIEIEVVRREIPRILATISSSMRVTPYL
jgi:hypothetical protein